MTFYCSFLSKSSTQLVPLLHSLITAYFWAVKLEDVMVEKDEDTENAPSMPGSMYKYLCACVWAIYKRTLHRVTVQAQS